MAKRSKTGVKTAFRENMHQKFLNKGKSHSRASTNIERKLPEKQMGKGSTMRTKSTIRLLNLYNQKVDQEKMRERPSEPARIQPDRQWFGNIRTIDQKSLEQFRVEMAQRSSDPRTLLIKRQKLPIELLEDPTKENKIKILELEKYQETFGPKSRRKKVKLDLSNLDEMAEKVDEQTEEYKVEKDRDLTQYDLIGERDENRDKRMEAGQSKRIWEELYKVLDSSDVICYVLDSRDPTGTRCKHLEQHIKQNCPQKHLVMILNKCDLIPTWLTAQWIQYLSKEYPTLAIHSSINNPFGKGSLINLLRQFDNFHQDKQTISVGFVGYPNVGKSSIINTLKSKKVCRAAPIPGETRVWQYVALTKRIYLIDCPGVVYMNEGKDDVDVVLKGCVRAERIDDPSFYIPEMLRRVRPAHLKRIYQIDDWDDYEDFLQKIAQKKGKLLKGGEADITAVGKIILMDWQRGQIPYFTFPPDYIDDAEMEQIKKMNEENEEKNEQEAIKQLEELNNQTTQNIQIIRDDKQQF